MQIWNTGIKKEMPSDRFSRLHHRQINCHYCDELLLIAVASYYGVGKKCEKCGNVNHPYDRIVEK